LTTWHCILSAELTKTHHFRLFLWRFCPLGYRRSVFKRIKFWGYLILCVKETAAWNPIKL